MALPQLKTAALIPPKAPNLPLSPEVVDRKFIDDLENTLRLYFNQIDNFCQPFASNTGGAFLRFPNGAFHQDGVTELTSGMSTGGTGPISVTSTEAFADSGSLLIEDELVGYTGKTNTTFTGITRGIYGSTNQSHSSGVKVSEALGVASASTALAIPFTSTDTSNAVAIDATYNTRVVFDTAGYYNVQFSAQLLNFTSTEDNVTFWFKKNGSDVDYSAGVVTVPKATSNPGATIISWNIVIDVLSSGYIELYYASTTGNSVVATYPAGTSPVTPISPSVILTATFVSALYP